MARPSYYVSIYLTSSVKRGTMTPDQAILVRNIVIVLAAFIIWGFSILTAHRLAGTTGSIFAFFLGPIGVVVAIAIGKDEKTTRRKQMEAMIERDTSAFVPPQSPGQATAARLANTAFDAEVGQKALIAELSIPADDVASVGTSVSGLSFAQEEMLRRILAHEVIQTGYLKQINRVAQWFFWWSILGAALIIATWICGNIYY